MLKKIFSSKRKHQDSGTRHTMSRISMDPASAAILTRHFSPLSSRVKSPSDLLDIIGYPVTSVKNNSPSPSGQTQSKSEEKTSPQYRLIIRNNATPNTPSSASDSQSIVLLETSREDKTLVELGIHTTEQCTAELSLDNAELERLHQKILEFEHEREVWHQKFQDYAEREEQMKKIIQENQVQINQLRSNTNIPLRHNSYRTLSTRSSWPTDDEDDDEEEEENEEDCYIMPHFPLYRIENNSNEDYLQHIYPPHYYYYYNNNPRKARYYYHPSHPFPQHWQQWRSEQQHRFYYYD
ncbi:uncharacterized protein B0P05DRAFT_532762 [Gilbertella persicaria]|uniref:uncharacterized protein n=1 Tax=Gilbertella persicaria TaxID=101096 RepID=UPI00221FB157|nr:uncharacterized protein B0P05DRAFT_532762 [Gilbertella persicaria]KAI8086883.1 hypothetical protein B0P05DRAFT_532762 [Gilbertella persicaria]